MLADVRQVTFPYLKSLLGLTDGNLGRHLEVLAGEGLVSITKGYENKRPRTWASLTDDGYVALTAEWLCSRNCSPNRERRRTPALRSWTG